MAAELDNVSGVIAKVRDHTVGVDGDMGLVGGAPYRGTRYFNDIEIDLGEPAMTLYLCARWPDRLFLQNGDRILAIGSREQGKFQVQALCNLTDNSHYLLCGSPGLRRRLKRMSAELLPAAASAHWFAA
nr:hypothetical protein [Dyella sp. ASV24]